MAPSKSGMGRSSSGRKPEEVIITLPLLSMAMSSMVSRYSKVSTMFCSSWEKFTELSWA